MFVVLEPNPNAVDDVVIGVANPAGLLPKKLLVEVFGWAPKRPPPEVDVEGDPNAEPVEPTTIHKC